MKFSDLQLKWKISVVLVLLLIPASFGGMAYVFYSVKNLEVYTALSGLMNFVDAKQQGVIRFIGQNEKLAKQLAALVDSASPGVAQKQFKTIVDTDIFKPNEHQFNKEIEDGARHIPTWSVYHAIDFVRDGEILISSERSRIGRIMATAPDLRHGYSDVYREGDVPVLSFGSKTRDGMVYVHVNAGMLTIIVNGEIGNLEGDMGAYYLAGVGKTFDYYMVNRDNLMITESRVNPDALLNLKGSEFPWLMTMGKAVEMGIICLPDGTYKTNAGHYTGQREAMGFYTGRNGHEMLGVSMPFYDSEWTIVVEQEADELLGPLYNLTRNFATGAGVLLLTILAAGFFLAATISRPLTNIIGNMSRLMKEETDITVDGQGRKDEIGALANTVEIFRENIEKKKRAELRVRHAMNTAQIANRAKTELLANMSHELRTPLNAIIGFSSTIKAEIFGPLSNSKYGEYVDDISKSGQHLLELINDILDTSAIEAGRFELNEETLSPQSLVEASVRLVRHRAREGRVNLSTQVDCGEKMFYGDERRMKQVLLNLLSNAIKFTPPDGTVCLDISLNEDEAFVFTIRDTGIGMSPEDQQKAMTPFGQVDSDLDRKHQGTGLGLPLTKGLVTLHDGTLDIISEPAIGTTVTLTFPKWRSRTDE